MISFVDTGNSSLFGIKSIIEIEKIPAVCLENFGEKKNGCLLVTDGKTTCGEIKNFAKIIFLGGINREIARQVFGIDEISLFRNELIELSLSHSLKEIFAQKQLLQYLPDEKLTLPSAERVRISPAKKVETLAYFADGEPAIIKRERRVWCLFSLGECFLHFIRETYFSGDPKDAAFLSKVIFNSWIRKIYYSYLPVFFRNWAQKKVIERLERGINKEKFFTSFPIEAGGAALIAIFTYLIVQVNGFLVRMKKWPHNKDSAFLFTHDIDPSRFSYCKGLPELTKTIEKKGIVPCLGLVAKEAKKYLQKWSGMSDFPEIVSHGLYHDGRFLFLDKDAQERRIKDSKEILEKLSKKKISGYRSPRLDRNIRLWEMLEKAGYQYDSSYPDVDRENTSRYGGGVGINYPFHPVIEDRGGFRFSRIFEYPVTAPDCIMPLFMGKSREEMLEIYRKKLSYIKKIEGLYVSIVHAGVFGLKDMETRLDLLDFLWQAANLQGFWIVSPEKLLRWLRQRDDLIFTFDDAGLILKNISPDSSSGLSLLVVSRDGKERILPVPEIGGNKKIKYKFEKFLGMGNE